MENAWLAWVPFANIWMILKAGDKSGWWLAAAFIPIVNIAVIVLTISAQVNIFKKLGKSPWLLLLLLLPLANFWVMYHVAFN